MWNSSRSPSRRHSAARTVRRKWTCSVSVGVKAVKSWFAGQGRGARVEGGDVQGTRVVKLVARPQRIAALARVQAVDVAPGASVPAGIERVGGRDRLADGHVGRQAVVQRDGREQAAGGQRDDVGLGVHAGIGAAGDDQLARVELQGSGELAGDGAQARLRRPSVEVGAVVRDGQPMCRHPTAGGRRAPGTPSARRPRGAGPASRCACSRPAAR